MFNDGNADTNSTSILLLLMSLVLLTVGNDVVHQCKSNTIGELFSAERLSKSTCSETFLNSLPSASDLSYIMDPSELDNHIRRSRKVKGVSEKKTKLTHNEEIQFDIGTRDNGETLVIFFWGTANGGDAIIDLRVKHWDVHWPELLSPQSKENDIFRVHSGVKHRMTNTKMQTLIEGELLFLYSDQYILKRDVISPETKAINDIKIKPKRLIIGGHSLGGAYALYFFLMLYGDKHTRYKPGMNVLPTDPKYTTVITLGAPTIIFHKDVDKICDKFKKRIFNFVNFGDPVPTILSGHNNIKNRNFMDIGDVLKHLGNKNLMRLGANIQVGNVIITMKGKKRIKFTKKQLLNKKKKQSKIGRFFKIYGSKKWKYAKDESIWFKFVKYDRVEHEYYLSYGAKCLRAVTNGGGINGIIFGSAVSALKQHMLGQYLSRFQESCIQSYLKTSKYYTNKIIPKLEKEK